MHHPETATLFSKHIPSFSTPRDSRSRGSQGRSRGLHTVTPEQVPGWACPLWLFQHQYQLAMPTLSPWRSLSIGTGRSLESVQALLQPTTCLLSAAVQEPKVRASCSPQWLCGDTAGDSFPVEHAFVQGLAADPFPWPTVVASKSLSLNFPVQFS